MSVGNLQTEADVARLIQRELDKPNLSQVQIADLRAEVDSLIIGAAPSGPAGGDLDGTYPNPIIGATKVTMAKLNADTKNQAAGTPSLRKIGTGATDVIAGNDSRMTNARTPTAHTHPQSDVTSLVSDLAAKAPLASPALTGNPTAPTQTAGNNSTRLATTAYADAIATLKANLASPTFTGDPKAPTPTTGDRDTSIATTSFVGNETDLVRLGFVVKPMVDLATTQALPAFGVSGSVLTATANGILDASFGADPESFPYDRTFQDWDGLYSGNWPVRPAAIAKDSSGNIYACGEKLASGISLGYAVAKWNSSGVLQTYFGSTGTGNGQFNNPQGIAVDSSGNIYVSDTGNNRVQKFDSSGTYVSKFGSAGSTDGLFSGSRGIALDSSGNIFVADLGNSRIQKFNSSGTYQSKFGTYGAGNGQFIGAYGITIDSSNNIFVTDTSNNRIQKFNSSGTYQSQFGTAGTGNGEMAYPYGVALDSSGNIFIADTGNNRVQKFDSSGTYVSQLGSLGAANGQFNSPRGVLVDSSSNVYVADYTNKRTQKFAYVNTSPVANGKGALVAHQGSPGVDNGLYTITNKGSVSTKWVLTRRTDADGSDELKVGTMVSAGLQGKKPGGLWFLSSAPDGSGGNVNPIVPGTTAITWEPYRSRPTAHGESHGPDGDDPIPAARAIAFRGYSDSAVSFTASSIVIFTCNQETFDTNGAFDTATNKGRFTAPLSGYYRVSAALYFSSGFGATYGAMLLYKNGGVIAQLDNVRLGDWSTMRGTDVVYLAAGDYIDLRVQNAHTSAAVSVASSMYSYFAGEFIGS